MKDKKANENKNERNKKNIEKRKNALALLRPLAGKTVKQMSKSEQENLLTVLAQLNGILDEQNRVGDW